MLVLSTNTPPPKKKKICLDQCDSEAGDTSLMVAALIWWVYFLQKLSISLCIKKLETPDEARRRQRLQPGWNYAAAAAAPIYFDWTRLRSVHGGALVRAPRQQSAGDVLGADVKRVGRTGSRRIQLLTAVRSNEKQDESV